MIIFYKKDTGDILGTLNGVDPEIAGMESKDGKEKLEKYIVPEEVESVDFAELLGKVINKPFDYRVKLNSKGLVIGFDKKS